MALLRSSCGDEAPSGAVGTAGAPRV